MSSRRFASLQSIRHVASSVFTKICMPGPAVALLARRRYIVSQREPLLGTGKDAKKVDAARPLLIHCVATCQRLYEDLRGRGGHMAVSSYAISTQSRGLTDVFTKICSPAVDASRREQCLHEDLHASSSRDPARAASIHRVAA